MMNSLPPLALKPLVQALVGASMMSLASFAAVAQVVVSGSATQVYNAPNGVTMVDIAKANAAGLSHNKYSQFNVDPKGLVLNNANSAQMMRQSQLAGQVSANLNLQQEAKVILNEVNGTSRSVLNGFIEVLGGKADVIIANPNGITTSGGGFINTSRATLTTGTPNVDADGVLRGFNINRGDILINGTGIDGRSLTYLDLVARSIKIDGQVNAQALNIALGANVWDYAAQSASATTPDAAAPALAFDSTALGGMYADRIRIVATEAGVGVRVLGEAAATAGDFTIDAAGRIVVSSAVSATGGKLALASSGAAADAITISGANASLTADKDIALTTSAANAGITLKDAALKAGENLAITSAGAVSDSAAAGNAGATRFANGTTAINAAGAVAVDNTSWGAGGKLAITAAGLSVGNQGATLYAGADANAADKTLGITTSGNLDLGTASVKTPGAITLSALGDLAVGAGADGVNSGGSISLGATGQLRNSGKIRAAQDITVRSTNAGGILAVANTGAIEASAGRISIAGHETAGVANHAVTLTNGADGAILAKTGIVLDADALTNSGRIQAEGDIGLTLAGALTNNSDGKILNTGSGAKQTIVAGSIGNAGLLQSSGDLSAASDAGFVNSGTVATTTAGADIALTAASITNSGTVQSAGILDASADTSLTNSGTLATLAAQQGGGNGALNLHAASLINAAAGKVLGAAAVTIGVSGAGGTVSNNGVLQAAGKLSAGAAGHAINLVNGTDASIIADELALVAGTLNNNGLMQTKNKLDVAATGALTNQGTILATGAAADITLAAAGFTNGGRIQAGNGMSLDAGAAFSNSGTVLAQNGDVGVDGAGSVTNSGTIAANAGKVDMAAATTMVNSGTVQAKSDLGINAGTSIDNQSGGKITSDAALTLAGSGDSFALTNAGRIEALGAMNIGDATHRAALANTGSIISGNHLTVHGNAIENVGAGAKILTGFGSGGDLTLALNGKLTNQGVIHADRDLTVSATGIDNSSTGGISARRDSLLTTATVGTNTGTGIRNAGSLFALRNLTVNAAGQEFNNLDSGEVATGNGDVTVGGNMTFTTDSFVNANNINASGNLTINTRTFHNKYSGTLPTIATGGKTWVTDLVKVTESGLFNCSGLPGTYYDCVRNRIFQASFTVTESWSGPMTAQQGQLIAGNALTLNYGGSAINDASIMSGKTVDINAGADADAFQNNDLHLNRYTYARRFRARNVSHETFFLAITKSDFERMVSEENNDDLDNVGLNIGEAGHGAALNDDRGYNMLEKTEVVAYMNAGLFGDTVRINGAVVNKAGVGKAAAAPAAGNTTTAAGGQTIGAVSAANNVAFNPFAVINGIGFTGLNLTLPSNPNGLFVVNRTPGAKYLVETNPLYASGSGYVGSDYLAKRFGLNTETLTTRLGDANYEAKLLREEIIAQTGRNILSGYATEAAQMKGLLDSAFTQSADLGLTFGTALTSEQVANLKQDLVWMVEQDVGGTKVLVPVVYLAKSTIAAVQNGAVIEARDLAITGEGVQNIGGSIKADTMNITTTGDITNLSGSISGGNVMLRSTAGDIANLTNSTISGDTTKSSTSIDKTGTISGTNIVIDAAKSIVVKGADITATGNAKLNAGENVVIDSIQDSSSNTVTSSSSTTLNYSSNVERTTTSEVKQVGSNVTTGNNLEITSGKAVTVGASNVTAGGNATIDAGTNLNIVDRQDQSSSSYYSFSKGTTIDNNIMSGFVKFSESTDKSSTVTAKSVGSVIKVGGNADLKSGGVTTLVGAAVNAGGNADIAGKDGLLILSGQNFSKTVGSSVTVNTTSTAGGNFALGLVDSFSKGGSAGDIVQNVVTGLTTNVTLFSTEFLTTKKDVTSQSSQSVGSIINAGGNLNFKSDGAAVMSAVRATAGQDLTVNAKSLDANTAANVSSESMREQITKISVGVGANALGNVSVTVSGSDSGSTSSSNASTAVSNVFEAGRDVTMKTGNDLNLGGTVVKAAGDINLEASDGNVNLNAARNTTNSESASYNIGGSLTVGRGISLKSGDIGSSAMIRINGGAASSTSSASTAVGSVLEGGGDVNISAGKNISTTATQIKSGDATNISAGGAVDLAGTTNTFSSQSQGGQAGFMEPGTIGGRAVYTGGNYNNSSAVNTRITTGADLKVEAGGMANTAGSTLQVGGEKRILNNSSEAGPAH